MGGSCSFVLLQDPRSLLGLKTADEMPERDSKARASSPLSTRTRDMWRVILASEFKPCMWGWGGVEAGRECDAWTLAKHLALNEGREIPDCP